MSVASVLSADDPPPAGGALPALPVVRLLRLMQRFLQTGRAMGRSVTRIAQQKVMGHDMRRMAPAGFDPTLTNAFAMQAVALTAALRERLRALAGRPVEPLAPGVPKPARAPRGRCTGQHVTVVYEVEPGDPHDWAALVKPMRVGRDGVAAALVKIAGKSDRRVVKDISDYLRKAAAQLGADADMPRLAALEAAALALCPAAADAEDDDATTDAAGGPGGARGAPAAGPASDGAASGGAACDPPPPKPPD